MWGSVLSLPGKSTESPSLHISNGMVPVVAIRTRGRKIKMEETGLVHYDGLLSTRAVDKQIRINAILKFDILYVHNMHNVINLTNMHYGQTSIR